jgi:hypothetical protein
MISLVGVGLALFMAASCVVAGLAVRAGVVDELLLWFPPDTRYQMIVRIGRDATPWSFYGRQPTALNVWVHDRRQERWHLVPLLHLQLGREPFRNDQPGSGIGPYGPNGPYGP